MVIESEKHQLQTIKTNKVSLSSFDKLFILADGNDCIIVKTLTEEEANAIEHSEYLIDFYNWFSDEFVIRVKRAKRRWMEIVSDRK